MVVIGSNLTTRSVINVDSITCVRIISREHKQITSGVELQRKHLFMAPRYPFDLHVAVPRPVKIKRMTPGRRRQDDCMRDVKACTRLQNGTRVRAPKPIRPEGSVTGFKVESLKREFLRPVIGIIPVRPRVEKRDIIEGNAFKEMINLSRDFRLDRFWNLFSEPQFGCFATASDPECNRD